MSVNQPFNRPVSDPQFADVLETVRREIFLSMNTHAIAKVVSFDPDNQTVVANMQYKKLFNKYNAATKVYENVLEEYPQLIDMPVVFLGGGPRSLTFPVQAGDDCIVLFNDRDLNGWFSGQAPTAPVTGRLHAFADGIALVGLRSLNDSLPSVDNEYAVLGDATVNVKVGDSDAQINSGNASVKVADKITIENTQQNLANLLTQILTQLQTLANSVAVPGVPINPGVAVSLQQLSTQLGQLLE